MRCFSTPRAERFPRVPYNAKRWVRDGWSPRATVEGDPHFGGELTANAVVLEGRQKADDALWDCRCRKGETVVLGRRLVGQPILSARDALDGSLLDEASQNLAVDAAIRQFARRYAPRATGKFKGAGSVGRGRHVAKPRQLFINGNVLPHLSEYIIAGPDGTEAALHH